MMLFVANIGSTMAKMFAFVFSRITMIFCCRISSKKKRNVRNKIREEKFEKPSTSNVSIIEETPKIPANVRLNQLTAATTTQQAEKNPSLNSSVNSIGERSKDAIVRINELIRQSSLQEVDVEPIVEEKRRKSEEFNPIQYYINETNKLTSNLDSSVPSQSTNSIENTPAETSSNTQSEQVREIKKSRFVLSDNDFLTNHSRMSVRSTTS